MLDCNYCFKQLYKGLPSFLKGKPFLVFIKQFIVFNNYQSPKACLISLIYQAAR